VEVVNVVVDEVVVRRLLVVDGRVRRVGRIRLDLVVVEVVDVVLVVVVVELDVGRRVRRVRRVGRVLLCRRVVVDVLVVIVVNLVVVVVDDSVVGANRFSVIGLFVTCTVLPA